MAFPVPRIAQPVEGVVVHRLRAGLPVLGHRPAARAAHRGGHQGHAGPRRARAPALPAPGRAHARRRPGLPRRGRRRPAATTPSTPALELDGDDEAAFQADAAAAGAQLLPAGGPPPCGPSASSCGSRPRSTASGCGASSTGSSSTTTASWSSPTTRPAPRPRPQYERKRLAGVHIYSLLCEQMLGRRPKRVQLLYLRTPLAITTEPTDRTTRGTRRTLGAVWQAVERACDREDFRPAAVAAVRRTAPSRPTARPSAATRPRPARLGRAGRRRAAEAEAAEPVAVRLSLVGAVGSPADDVPPPARRSTRAVGPLRHRHRHPGRRAPRPPPPRPADVRRLRAGRLQPDLAPASAPPGRSARTAAWCTPCGSPPCWAPSRRWSTGRSRACSAATGPPGSRSGPAGCAGPARRSFPSGHASSAIHGRRPAVAGRPAVAAVLRHRRRGGVAAGCT